MKTISLLLICTLRVFAQSDFAGSSDHPLITRFPGSTIGYYEEQQFQEYHIAAGPVTGYKEIKKWMKVEGKFTRIYYVAVDEEASLHEIFSF